MMDGRNMKTPPYSDGSKKYEIEESASEEKIGMRYMDLPQGHVGKRDLKRKCEEHDHFTDRKASTLCFPLFQVRP